MNSSTTAEQQARPAAHLAPRSISRAASQHQRHRIQPDGDVRRTITRSHHLGERRGLA